MLLYLHKLQKKNHNSTLSI